jgi:hypothetical protein
MSQSKVVCITGIIGMFGAVFSVIRGLNILSHAFRKYANTHTENILVEEYE